MAHIAGLAEQKKALSDIESMLKEVQVINNFLQKENPSGVYEISFTLDNTNVKMHLAEDSETTQSTGIENSSNKDDKKRRASKSLKCTAPFICHDRHVIRTCVLSSKKEKVDKIKALANKYNIFLDNEEEAILKMFEEDM